MQLLYNVEYATVFKMRIFQFTFIGGISIDRHFSAEGGHAMLGCDAPL
jgi:hypothetical protein